MNLRKLSVLGGTSSPIDVSLFGADGSSLPSKAAYPKKFAPNSKFVWDDIFDSKEYQRLIQTKTPDEVWSWLIYTFLRNSSKRGVFPFASTGPQSSTDALYNCMWSGRRNMIRYVDRIGLFQRVKLFRTVREYTFTPTSTSILTIAELTPIRDPSFAAWLTGLSPNPMFVVKKARVYERLVYDNVNSRGTLEMNLLNMSRPVLKMDILCRSPIDPPRLGRRPTQDELAKYCQDIIWLPLVRTFRFKNTTTRLF